MAAEGQLDAPRAVRPLTVDEVEAWEEQTNVGARRPERARGGLHLPAGSSG